MSRADGCSGAAGSRKVNSHMPFALSFEDSDMPMTPESVLAPPLRVSQWFNSAEPISLDALRGRVVLLHAFQMLCPACVSHGLPQTLKARELFRETDLAVIGLHTVFEHHAVMNAAALQVFIAEYRLTFPIGIDEPAETGSIPLTMRAYALEGTPSLVLIDRAGRVRASHFGIVDDLALGGLIGRLIGEERGSTVADAAATPVADADGATACDDNGCRPSSD